MPRAAPLVAGLLVLVAASFMGWNSALVTAIVDPPLPARLALALATLLVAVALLAGAVERLRGDAQPATLVRGVRLVFLAVGAIAAGIGWLLGSPLPVAVGLIVGAIDLVETTFLLLVTAVRNEREGSS
jgi:hypothetical protein